MNFNIKTSKKTSKQNVGLTRRRTEERDIRFCEKRKKDYLSTTYNDDYSKVYKDDLDKQVPLVKIHYGPYEAHGLIRHRPQKLYGIVGNIIYKF